MCEQANSNDDAQNASGGTKYFFHDDSPLRIVDILNIPNHDPGRCPAGLGRTIANN
jgi:hypothetical protein